MAFNQKRNFLSSSSLSSSSFLVVLLIFLTFFSSSCFGSNAVLKSLRQRELFSKQLVERLNNHQDEIELPPAQFFTQTLDHFNPQDNRTWQQRYYVNDSFWSPELNGPIFFQIGGEGTINAAYVTVIEMAVFAQQYGALMVVLEHRFYGESQPLPDLSTDNLQYLSSQQALADAATFIQAFKEQYNAQKSPVISFGGSYPGNLAAWFRLKYPHLTIASVASSAPVQATLDFYQYLDVVDQSLSYFTGIQCDNAIRKATIEIELLLNSTEGQTQLQKLFNTCTVPSNSKDIANFMSSLMGNWMGTVQYNDEGGNPIDINYLCGMMLNNTASPLNAYVNVSNLFLKLQQEPCLDISYSDMVTYLQNVTNFGVFVGERQWYYQTCSEFAYFQTTDSGPTAQPFGNLVPLSFYTESCYDIFQVNFNTPLLVNYTNTVYGGKNLATGPTNILFVNGNIDPWHSLSVINDLSDTLNAILIQGTAHCADMLPATPNDPKSLAKAQENISEQIGKWLMNL